MTAPADPQMQRVNEGALDALALVESCLNDNPANRNYLLSRADRLGLFAGMTLLAKSLITSLAVELGLPPDEVVRLQRDVLLCAADGAA